MHRATKGRAARAAGRVGWTLALALVAACTSTPEEPVTVALSPTTATVAAGGSWQFSATVKGAKDTAVTWAVVEAAGGSVSASGLYTAPQTAGQYTVRAVSRADAGASAQARVTVTAQPVSVSVSPVSATLVPGEQVALGATVQGAQDAGVTWSVEGGEAHGTVTAEGVYTAPARAGTFRVLATSRADATRMASATLTVVDALSGTVSYAGGRTGRIYVTYGLADEFGNLLVPLATTSIPGPGPFTLRPLRSPQGAPLAVQAFLDVSGTGTLLPASSPSVLRPLTYSGAGASVDLVLEEPAQQVPGQAPGLSVTAGPGFLWVSFQPVHRLEGGEAADAYVVSWSEQPAPTPDTATGTLVVPAGTSQLPFRGYMAAIPAVAPSTWYVSVTARSGELQGEPAQLADAVVVAASPEGAEDTLAGWVDLTEVGPKAGHLYVLALGTSQQAFLWRTGADSLATTRYGLALPADGYLLYALLDQDADGLFEPTEPATSEPLFALVDGVTPVQPDTLRLDSAPVHAVLGTERYGTWDGSFFLEASGLYVGVKRGSRLPVHARLTGSPGLPPPYDMLPFDLPFGVGGFELAESFPGQELPLPAGTSLSLEVHYDDDTSASLPLAVTLPAVATFTSPGATVAGSTPTFAWTLPDGTPEGGTQELVLTGPGGRGEVELWRVRFPPAARSATYDGAQPLEPGVTYSWEYRMLDGSGNVVGMRGSFLVE